MNRRSFLRGTCGVTVNLPFLEILASQKPNDKLRLACLFMPNGISPGSWPHENKNFASTILQPLKGHKKDITILNQLCHENSQGGDGHYAKTANWLSGAKVKKTTGRDLECATSVDQIIAQKVSTSSAIPSLELGMEADLLGVDETVGYSKTYGSHISWGSPNTPISKEIYPEMAFDRLFNRQSNKYDKLILDSVSEDIKGLQKRLGKEDKIRLDRFITTIHELDRQLQQQKSAGKVSKVNKPDFKRSSFKDRMRQMIDVMVLAFEMNKTRVITFMMGNAVSSINYSFLNGVNSSFHEVSHHQNDPEKLKQYRLINQFHIEQLAYFLGRLASIEDGDQSLLYNSIILFGSGLNDGNFHQHENLPVLLAGQAGGRLKSGRVLSFQKKTPLSNLYLNFLNYFNIEKEYFSDSTGMLF